MTVEQLEELGFDMSYVHEEDSEDYSAGDICVWCSQCEAMVINGYPTHENGCPNTPTLEDEDIEDDHFDGYWYRDADGNQCHTWDFEESMGE